MRILIATDGSIFSQAAVEKCCRLVIDPASSNIKLISVYRCPLPLDISPQAVEMSQEMERDARKQAEKFVKKAARQIRRFFSAMKIDISTEIKMGLPNQVIVKTSKTWHADLIVVGSHGKGFLRRALLGSVSDSVVHHAPCPVLVVRKRLQNAASRRGR